VLKNHFLRLSVFYLVFLNNVILIDRFHGEQLLGIFFFYQQHCSKCSFTQHNLRQKVIYSYLLFHIVSSIECSGSFSDHLFLLLLSLNVLLERNIIMKNVVSFDCLNSLLLFLIFCSGEVNQVQFFSVVDGEFGTA